MKIINAKQELVKKDKGIKKFMWIINEEWRKHTELTYADKIVYLTLADFEKGFTGSNEQLAKNIGLSLSGLNQSLRRLKDAGLIETKISQKKTPKEK